MIWFVALGQERLGTPFSLESWLSTASFPGLAISLRGRNACRAADMTMVQHVWVAGMDPSPARLVGRGKVMHGWSSEAVSKLSGSRAISIQPLPDAASDAGRLSVPACGYSCALGPTVDSQSPPGGGLDTGCGLSRTPIFLQQGAGEQPAWISQQHGEQTAHREGWSFPPGWSTKRGERKRPLSGGCDH